MPHASPEPPASSIFRGTGTLFPRRSRRLAAFEATSVAVGLLAIVLRYGMRSQTGGRSELGIVVVACVAAVCGSLGLRYRLSLAHRTFMRTYRASLTILLLWLVGVLILSAFGPAISRSVLDQGGRLPILIVWSELNLLILCSVVGVISLRRAAARGASPALLLVVSFVSLILIGTLLLKLPVSRAVATPTPWSVALFTATSASCVTGLIVVDTPSYWSLTGQLIILSLFQIGGLGIMTCGAFFVLGSIREMPLRERATLSELLGAEQPGTTRQLLLAVLTFTLVCELAGALLISGLWSDLPWDRRAYYSVFHSVSAFCNAGFALHSDSFVGRGHLWPVWGVLAALIILGGSGFSVLYNLAMQIRERVHGVNRPPLFGLPQHRIRLSVGSRLALLTMAGLLLSGTLALLILEAPADSQTSLGHRVANAWFQSVTFRTAGFNTVDHAELQTGTKLIAIMLMFIGANPSSTGGGVKTITVALAVLAVVAILRGRDRVECFGRTIPVSQVNRALTVIAVSMAMVMLATILLVLFEQRPDRLLDHMYEATSALGTVGVSTGITAELTLPSRFVLIAGIFLGRIGPLTLLLALASGRRTVHYEYPDERVPLG